MEKAIKNSIMTKGLKQHMKHYLSTNKIFLSIFLILLSTSASISFAGTEKDVIRAVLVKENSTIGKLINETKNIAPPDSDIETNQIVKINYDNHSIYIVPARANGDDDRGCYIFTFDNNIQMSQKITLSKLEELESCEIIKAVFSCNRENKTTSGIGVLYGKRMGADHYWFEGSYLTLAPTGALSNDNKLSGRLNDIDTVLKAKKKLGCR